MKAPRNCCRCSAPLNFSFEKVCKRCSWRGRFITRYLSGATLAHAAVSRERAAGRLADPKTARCTDCGGVAIEYDHRDYNEPLRVEPVCRRCNLLRGRAISRSWAPGEFAAYLDRVRAQNQTRPAHVLQLVSMFPDLVPNGTKAAA